MEIEVVRARGRVGFAREFHVIFEFSHGTMIQLFKSGLKNAKKRGFKSKNDDRAMVG
jgi:hypothetical protein